MAALAHLDVVADGNATYLRDLLYSAGSARKAEAVRPENAAGVQNAVVADSGSGHENRIGIQCRALAYVAVFAHINSGEK